MNNFKTIDNLKAHISLNVKSIADSIEFYRQFFGIEPMKVRRGYAKFDVQNPPLNLALNESTYNINGALSHLGIQVASTEDVLATKAHWESIGLLTRDEMQTNCCYALQDKTWVRDPDGNEWEVFVVLEDNLAGVEESVEKSAACCPPISIGIKNEADISAASCC